MQAPRHPYLVLLPVGFTLPLSLPIMRWALTPPFHPYPSKMGGLFSAALSLGSPPPDVIRHRYSMEPGLSSQNCLKQFQAVARPTDTRLTITYPNQIPEIEDDIWHKDTLLQNSLNTLTIFRRNRVHPFGIMTSIIL